MDVAADVTVIGEFDKLRAALADGPSSWMPGMFDASNGKLSELEADTPLGRLAQIARFEIGPAEVGASGASVPISWRANTAEPLFPIFDGRLTLQRLADGSNRLQLAGGYDPPAGPIGRAADAAGLHSVATATVTDFVERVAGVLARNALSRSAAEQEGSGRLKREEETWR